MRISFISLLLCSTASAMTIPSLARQADSATITKTDSGLQLITTANGATMLVGGAADVSVDGEEATVELEPNEITTDRGSDIILPAGTSIQVNDGGDLSIGGSEVTRGGQTIVP